MSGDGNVLLSSVTVFRAACIYRNEQGQVKSMITMLR